MTTPSNAAPKHTPEPWEAWPFGGDMRRGGGYITAKKNGNRVEIIEAKNVEDAQRSIACVNTLAGIADPVATLQKVREALEGLVSSADTAPPMQLMQRLSQSIEQCREALSLLKS